MSNISSHARVIEQKLDDILLHLNRNSGGSKGANRGDEHPHISGAPPSATPTGVYSASTEVEEISSDVVTIIPGFQMTHDKADLVLKEYMSTMVYHFPFVPLPPAVCKTSFMLKETPLLLKTILSVCMPSSPDVNRSFETWFRQHIAHRVVVSMERNLELLQAILVFLAWKDIQFYAHIHDTSLLQLAIGLAGDLGLTNCPEIPEPAFESIVEDAARLRNDLRSRTQHSSAERRSVLGLFYLTSVLSGLMGRKLRLGYTSYFDRCCTQLLQVREFSTDSILVYLVRLRKIAIRVDNIFSTRRDTVNGKQKMVSFQWSQGLAITSAQNELDEFIKQLPESFQTNYLLRENYTAIRIRLFESTTHFGPSDHPELTMIRSRIMWDCFENVHTLLDLFLTIPLEIFPFFTFVTMLNLALGIIKACTFLCLDDRDWDKDFARRKLDLQHTLERLSDRFEEANRLGHPRCGLIMDDTPMFSGYARNFDRIKEWYSSKTDVNTGHRLSLTDELFNFGSEGADFWQQLSGYSYEGTL